MKTEVTISAKGKKLGRLATEVATILMGKTVPGYKRNVTPETKVSVTDAKEMDMRLNRLSGIEHKRYSGYPGGLRIVSGDKVAETKGYGELLKHAVSKMLPKNKLRTIMMKNLTVNE